jgi:hypothetical protein
MIPAPSRTKKKHFTHFCRDPILKIFAAGDPVNPNATMGRSHSVIIKFGLLVFITINLMKFEMLTLDIVQYWTGDSRCQGNPCEILISTFLFVQKFAQERLIFHSCRVLGSWNF